MNRIDEAKKLRAEGMTQAKIAETLGTAQTTVSYWLRQAEEKPQDPQDLKTLTKHFKSALLKKTSDLLDKIESQNARLTKIEDALERHLNEFAELVALVQGQPKRDTDTQEPVIKTTKLTRPATYENTTDDEAEAFLRQCKG